MFIIKIFGEIVRDWFIYKLRGQVKPDHKNDPIITGPEDAAAQRTIDKIFQPKKK